MSNDWYNPNGKPSSASRALSADVRSELASIGAAFDALPSKAILRGGMVNFGTDTGSANAYLVAVDSSISSLVTGLTVRFKALNANTGASTVAVNSLPAKQVLRPNGQALAAGDIASGQIVQLSYEATSDVFQLSMSATGGTPNFSGVAGGTVDLLVGASIASAATINLNSTTGNFVHITGTTTITAVTLTRGPRWVVFDGVLTLTHNATTNNLPGAKNITTAAGDRACYFSDGTIVYCIAYLRADGTALTSLGQGSAIQSPGNFTLTAASTAVQRVSAPGYGYFGTLPDATTMPIKGTPVFCVTNTGEFPMGLKDNGGTIRGWVYPLETVNISLQDNSTASGTWNFHGSRDVAIEALYANTTLSVGSTAKVQAITLDSDRVFLLFGDTSVYGVVYTRSTASFGTATLIRATLTSGKWWGILAATNNVLVVSEAGTPSTTSIQGVVCSTSAATITVNTPANPTIAAAASAWGLQIVSFGGGFGFSYVRNTGASAQAAVIGISVTGTTVAFGSDIAIGAAGISVVAPLLSVSGTTMVAFTSDRTNITARSYTISGSSLSGGTAATVADTNDLSRVIPYGTRWLLLDATTTPRFASASLSGTVMSLTGLVSSGVASLTSVDMVALSSTKILVTGIATTAQFLVVTDNGSGSISVGSAVSITGSTAAPYWVNNSGTTARCVGAADGFLYTVDCSGATPSVTQQRFMASTSSIAAVASGQDNATAQRNYTNLAVGTWGSIAIPTAGTQVMTLAVTPNGHRIKPVDFMPNGSNGCVGADSTESWVMTSTLANGVFLEAIRAATPN